MDKGRRRGRSGAKAQQSAAQEQRRQQARPRMKFIIDSDIYVPLVQEPMVECSICGKPIETIANAISEPDGAFSHFDCVLEKLASSRPLGPGQKISYLGKGTFGVVGTADGKFVIADRISYESSEAFSEMKSFVERHKK